MLDVAIKWEDELRSKFYDTWFDEKYKYYYNDGNFHDYEADCNSENRHQFACIHDQYIIGYIGYDIHRNENRVDNFGAINFTNKHIEFATDLMTAINDIFYKYNFDKINFEVIVGNPAEEKYDNLIKVYNGVVAGYYKNHVRLMDGQLYDSKIYEIYKPK